MRQWLPTQVAPDDCDLELGRLQRLRGRGRIEIASALAGLTIPHPGARTHIYIKESANPTELSRANPFARLWRRLHDRFQALILPLGGGEGGIRTLDTA